MIKPTESLGISLVVATIGKNDIRPLLNSLERQTSADYECIVVDQSNDCTLLPVVGKYRNVKYIYSKVMGNSFNRNIGIQNAKFPIIGFPDDDCYYNDNLVENVINTFARNQEVDGIAGEWIDPNTGKRIIGGNNGSLANFFNVWTTITNITVFLRAEIVNRVSGYDERFGLGSGIFEGGEETDFLLKILDRHGKVLFVPNITVLHESKNYTVTFPKKQWGYEESWGALFRKWASGSKNGLLVTSKFAYQIAKTYLGAIWYALQGNDRYYRLYLMKNAARYAGWKKYGKVKP
jgi:glycosyltransferase involved in cell wall biosynthesis